MNKCNNIFYGDNDSATHGLSSLPRVLPITGQESITREENSRVGVGVEGGKVR